MKEILINEPTLEQFENVVKKVLLSDNFKKTKYENRDFDYVIEKPIIE